MAFNMLYIFGISLLQALSHDVVSQQLDEIAFMSVKDMEPEEENEGSTSSRYFGVYS